MQRLSEHAWRVPFTRKASGCSPDPNVCLLCYTQLLQWPAPTPAERWPFFYDSPDSGWEQRARGAGRQSFGRLW